MELLAVFTTVSDNEQAELLAVAAVSKGVAACVQAEPIHSVYRWKGELAKESEVRLMFKTTKTNFGALKQLLLDLHPYELPAIYALEVSEASAAYVSWVKESVHAPTKYSDA